MSPAIDFGQGSRSSRVLTSKLKYARSTGPFVPQLRRSAIRFGIGVSYADGAERGRIYPYRRATASLPVYGVSQCCCHSRMSSIRFRNSSSRA